MPDWIKDATWIWCSFFLPAWNTSYMVLVCFVIHFYASEICGWSTESCRVNQIVQPVSGTVRSCLLITCRVKRVNPIARTTSQPVCGTVRIYIARYNPRFHRLNGFGLRTDLGIVDRPINIVLAGPLSFSWHKGASCAAVRSHRSGQNKWHVSIFYFH